MINVANYRAQWPTESDGRVSENGVGSSLASRGVQAILVAMADAWTLFDRLADSYDQKPEGAESHPRAERCDDSRHL